VIFEYLQAFGATEATAEDLALAGQLYEAIPEKNRGGTAANVADSYDQEGEALAEALKDSPLVQLVMPRTACVRRYGASTDVGDVSQIKPTGFLTYSCFVKDIPLHTWQAVSFGKTHYAHAGMLQVARILGAAAMRLADSPDLVEKAKAEQRRQSEKEPYVCIFPEQMKPPIKPRPSEN
jgi:aminobenzoyl-glutamate utilization protein B